MDYPEPDNSALETLEELCNIAKHLREGRTVTIEITSGFTFEDPPDRLVMWTSKEGEDKGLRSPFGYEVAEGIQREYLTFNPIDDTTGALTFGPKSQELLSKCMLSNP